MQLTLEDDYLPNLDVLKSLVDENTKMITINNPNNPTGSWIPVETMEEIIEIARSVDAYVLCDEVYRGISEDGSYMQSIVDLYDKGISVGSMSKVFSLAGRVWDGLPQRAKRYSICAMREEIMIPSAAASSTINLPLWL